MLEAEEVYGLLVSAQEHARHPERPNIGQHRLWHPEQHVFEGEQGTAVETLQGAMESLRRDELVLALGGEFQLFEELAGDPDYALGYVDLDEWMVYAKESYMNEGPEWLEV